MQRPQNWIPEIEYYKIMSLNGAEKQLSKVNVVGGMQPNIATAIALACFHLAIACQYLGGLYNV